MRWPAVGKSVVMCFVIGRRHVAPALLGQLDAEADRYRDILFLPRVADGCVSMVSIGKAFAFWRTASRIVLHGAGERRGGAPPTSSPAFIAKADDDSLVNIPLLLDALGGLSCLPYVYYGAFGFTGYNPVGFRNCGFAWGGGGSYYKYGCEAGGAHPPYPFALGQLQALSAPLAAALTSNPDAVEFAAAAEAEPRVTANEDSAIGYMMSHLPASIPVTYVYMGRGWHNLGCYPGSGMYRQPAINHSVVVHRLIAPGSSSYVWDVLARREPPDIVACVNAMAAKEGPIDRMRSFCSRCSTAEGRSKYATGKAPFGCADIGNNRGRIISLKTSCARHGLDVAP